MWLRDHYLQGAVSRELPPDVRLCHTGEGGGYGRPPPTLWVLTLTSLTSRHGPSPAPGATVHFAEPISQHAIGVAV